MRERRRAALEPLIARDMANAYPELRPVQYESLASNTYVLARILVEAEDESDYSLRANWKSPGFRMSRYSSPEGEYLEFDDGFQLVRISKADDADAEILRKMLVAWTEDFTVKEGARDMAAHLAQLATALGRFRETMKDLTFSLDLEFRPEH